MFENFSSKEFMRRSKLSAYLHWSLLLLPLAGLTTSCHDGEIQSVVTSVIETPSPEPTLDSDADGYSALQGDCDDTNAAIFPNAPEGSTNNLGEYVGDSFDNNCDGRIDEGTIQFDDDSDGFSEIAADCDDTNGEVFPGQLDGCNGKDDDCDAQIDEDAGDNSEPNDGEEDATYLGDITCLYAYREFSIHTDGDRDFFRIDILNDSTACDAGEFGITAYLLSSDAAEKNYLMNVYRLNPNSGELELDDATSSTISGENSVSSQEGGDDALGTYFVEIGAAEDDSATNAVQCSEEVRLYFYGVQGFVLDAIEF